MGGLCLLNVVAGADVSKDLRQGGTEGGRKGGSSNQSKL